MKPIQKDELYEHLSHFLKGRGIDLKDRNYSKQFQNGCSILTDAVNLTQQGMERAKSEIDKRLEQLRQVIHEKTAPKTTSGPPPTQAPPSQAANAKGKTRTKSKATKRGKPIKRRKP